MPSRRDFLRATGAVGASALVQWELGTKRAYAAAKAKPVKLPKFVDQLITVIPTLTPVANPAYPGADYYEIFMAGSRWQFSSQLPVTALGINPTTWGYGSGAAFLGYLGPTIEATSGRPVVVKYINNINPLLPHPLQAAIDWTVPDPLMYGNLPPGRVTPHLHGGFTEPGYDGHPHSWWTSTGGFAALTQAGSHYASLDPVSPVGTAVYRYSNAQQAAMLWYHDHAMGITRLNVYAGLAALYFVRDALDTGLPTNPLRLPAGPYEVPLVIQDKQFNLDGSLFYPTVGITPTHPIWVPEFFGDTAVVNARAFPFMNVEPRRYRFRMVNGSQARFYNMWLAGPGKGNLPLWVIGMEQSLLSTRAVPLQQLLLAPGERADVIVDFTGIKPGTTFTLSNNANVPFPGGGPGAVKIPDLMQFRVVAPPVGAPLDTSLPPASLVLPTIAPLVPTPGAPVREIVMKETMDPVLMVPLHVRLNELWFDEPTVGVEETPAVNSTEIWQWVNLTVDAHPMHMHLVKFQVVNRQAFNVATYTTAYMAWVAGGRVAATKPNLAAYLVGPLLARAPEESGWKDTVKAPPGQITRVISTFDVPAGTVLPADYVFHCHILEHEENEMMRPFQVV